MAFSENAFGPTDASSITLFQNGTTAMGPVTISGSGTGVIDLQTSTALAPNDWVLMHYQPTSGANAFTDVLGNAYSSPAGGVNLAIGNLQSNTINLSGLGLTSGATLIGNSGADILVGTNQSDVVWGGPGGDTMTGGAGTDSFVIYQGDSPGLSSVSVGAGGTPGVFGDGDKFTLNNGFDRITDFSTGEVITFQSPLDFNLPNPASIGPGFPASVVVPDNSFYTVQGNLVGNVFTVNSTTGTDTLINYDSSTTALQMTTVVLSGVTLSQLLQTAGSNTITHV
jgi:Ca2+-binding RTX toxin-like protein